MLSFFSSLLLLNYKKKLLGGKQSGERICGLTASCILIIVGSSFFRWFMQVNHWTNK